MGGSTGAVQSVSKRLTGGVDRNKHRPQCRIMYGTLLSQMGSADIRLHLPPNSTGFTENKANAKPTHWLTNAPGLTRLLSSLVKKPLASKFSPFSPSEWREAPCVTHLSVVSSRMTRLLRPAPPPPATTHNVALVSSWLRGSMPKPALSNDAASGSASLELPFGIINET